MPCATADTKRRWEITVLPVGFGWVSWWVYNPCMKVTASEASTTGPDLTALPQIQQTLLDWYAHAGRDLPWRRTRDPYAILVSELMLQQTQVDRVIPKWEAWLTEFPTVQALADAPTSAVIKAWSGL